MADKRTFKVSDLPLIQKIDGDDLLLVSDRENGAYDTRSMTVQQMVGAVALSAQSVPGFAEYVAKTAAQRMSNPKDAWDREPLSQMVLLNGEVVLGSEPDGSVSFKTGDGVSTVSQLEWTRLPGVVMGTSAYWRARPSFCPPPGQIVVWTDKSKFTAKRASDGLEAEVCVPGLKIGDGNAFNIDMPFVAGDVERRLDAHVADAAAHVSADDRASWDNKVTVGRTPGADGVEGETLVITRN